MVQGRGVTYVAHKYPMCYPQCADEDECAFSNPCNQICTNTYGSFECSCTDGYVLLEDLTSCGGVLTRGLD